MTIHGVKIKKEEPKEEPIKVEDYITGKVENKYLQEVQKTLFLMPVIEKYLKDKALSPPEVDF